MSIAAGTCENVHRKVVVHDLRVMDVGFSSRQSGTQILRSPTSSPRFTPGYFWKTGPH